MSAPRIHTSEFPPVETPSTPIHQTVLASAAARGDHPALIDAGQDAGLAANSAKYAAAEAAVHADDQAIQTHGGNGLSQEYGVAALLAMSRVSRIAPVSREMILSFVAQHDLQLPRSY